MPMSLFQSLALLVAAPAASPASPGGYARGDLDVVINVGFREFDRMKDRCLPTTEGAPAVEPDVDAELAFVRMAEMVQLVVSNYPYTGPEGQRQHSDDLHQAVQGYERAYLCNPGWERRDYLNRAITLLERRIKQIRDVERRPNTSPDWIELQKDLARVRGLLGELHAPAACSSTTGPCPAPGLTSVAEAPPRPHGYRSKYMDVLSLRVELAGGFKTDFDAGKRDMEGKSLPAERQAGVVLFSLTPGVRFLVGKHQRHVFGFGFTWTLVSIRSDLIQQLVPRFEYGIRLHERWLSIHAAFEPGLQVKPTRVDSFGRFQIGGSGALCTWGESFCVRIGGYYTILNGTYVDGGYVGAGFDIFRITDNLVRRSD